MSRLVHPLLKNILDKIERDPYFPDPARPHVSQAALAAEARAMQMINEEFLKRFGEELFPWRSRYMSGPISSDTHQGMVEARTFRFQTEYRSESVGNFETEEDVYEWLCLSLRDELWDEMERLAMLGKVMHPYLPVIAVHKFDPHTFEPYFLFTSRFGIGDP